jgi:DNA invertase Pin-like site-specific DNA recombinase
MTDLGYIRISSAQQHLDQQRDELLARGIDPRHIYEDTISGARSKRPGLDALLAYARPGDTVTILRLDRLGRSVPHVLATMNDLAGRGIVLRSLREGLDLGTAAGKMVATFLAAIAEYERDLLRERLHEARTSHEAKGGKWGRPSGARHRGHSECPADARGRSVHRHHRGKPRL